MKCYIYIDNNKGELKDGKWTAPTVFTCVARNISIADHKFEIIMDEHPSKMRNIGCLAKEIQIDCPLCGREIKDGICICKGT